MQDVGCAGWAQYWPAPEAPGIPLRFPAAPPRPGPRGPAAGIPRPPGPAALPDLGAFREAHAAAAASLLGAAAPPPLPGSPAYDPRETVESLRRDKARLEAENAGLRAAAGGRAGPASAPRPPWAP